MNLFIWTFTTGVACGLAATILTLRDILVEWAEVHNCE